MTGVLLELVLVVSVVGIGALLFPVLRRRNEGLAMGYVGTRILESVLLLAASVSGLVFLKLSQEHGRAGVDGLAPLGDAVLAGRDRSSLLGGLVMLGVSTLILNSLLLTAKLVPSWLAGWGLIGGALVLVVRRARALRPPPGRRRPSAAHGAGRRLRDGPRGAPDQQRIRRTHGRRRIVTTRKTARSR